MVENFELLEAILRDLKRQLDRIEAEVAKISKHVPFVDSLASSGVVRAVSSLNRLFTGRFLEDCPSPPEIADTQKGTAG